MNAIKGLIAGAIAMSLLVLPAGALAKGRDRDHDRMPDKWEKAHHLNPRANDARKDADKDGLRNLSEFRHHTDPQAADSDDDGIDDNDEVENRTNPLKDDSDDDGVDDADEISGTIVSFQNNVLTIQLPGQGAGTVAATVNDATRIECDDENDDDAQAPTAAASHDGSDDDAGNSGPGSGDDDANHDAGDDHGDDNANCTATDLKQGARVHEAKLATASDGSKAFTKIELVPSA